jgi:alkane 1-monooxygenase
MTTWKDPKRYAWFLAALVPLLVMASWLLVKTTGIAVFWWLGPLLVFVGLPIIDYLVGIDRTGAAGDAHIDLDRDHPLYGLATWLYLPNQYLSLIFACWLWSGGGWVSMSLGDKLGLMATVGISGGIGINAAHELGHRRVRMERRLSKLALAQTCYGHFFVEHNRGHHVRAATPQDNASSRLGEGFYSFLPRSVIGGVRSAWQLETRRLGRLHHSPWTLKNDNLNAWLLSVVLVVGLALWFHPVVLPWLAGQAVVGICLLEMANYVQHYGLRRQLLPNGRYERIGIQHSWNCNYLITNVFLFHLQRHSDHHANPQRRFAYLRGVELAPQLPAGYATMFLLAAVPPLWRRVMDPRVINYYGGRIERAAVQPRRKKALLRKHSDRQVMLS